MRAALLAEYRKLVSTRIWWILALAMVVYLGFMGLVLGFAFTVEPPEGSTAQLLTGEAAARSAYSLVTGVGYVFALVVGSLALTTEFRHKTITATLLAEPRRTVVLLAKLVATIPVGLAYGLVATAAVLATAAPLLAWRGDGAYLTDGGVLTAVALGVVVMVLWTMFGVAFGAVLPNQVAAIVVVLAFTQFVEPIARIGLGAFDATSGVAKFLPGAAADGVVGSSYFAGFGTGSPDLLSRPVAALVLVAYVVVLAVVGRATTLRRDIS